MSDKLECPNTLCKKKSERDDFKFEWHKNGRVGVCPECGKKCYLNSPARGIIKDDRGVARKRFRNS